MTLRSLNDPDHLPALDRAFVKPIRSPNHAGHAPRILLLYGSLRERSFSRLMTEEAAHVLRLLGADTQIYDSQWLPLPDGEDASHPKVADLRDLVTWAEGMVWCSPERHGAMTAVMKAQIDWIPLALGQCGRLRARHLR